MTTVAHLTVCFPEPPCRLHSLMRKGGAISIKARLFPCNCPSQGPRDLPRISAVARALGESPYFGCFSSLAYTPVFSFSHVKVPPPPLPYRSPGPRMELCRRFLPLFPSPHSGGIFCFVLQMISDECHTNDLRWDRSDRVSPTCCAPSSPT